MKFIFFIITLLLASLYVYSEDIDSVDGEFCLTLETPPALILVKKNNDVEIRTAENLIECESPYNGEYGVSINVDFIDKLGKSIAIFRAVRNDYVENFYDYDKLRRRPYTLPREIQIDLPQSMQGMVKPIMGMPQKENEGKFCLLQFKDKIVDGDMRVSISSCKPHKLEYKMKFLARITGECECDSTEYKKNIQKNKK